MIKPTTLMVMIIGTTAIMSARKLGMSSTTPSIIGPMVALRSKAIFVTSLQNTAINPIRPTAYLNVIVFSDVR